MEQLAVGRNVDEATVVEASDSIAKLFGAELDPNEDWGHNLWLGKAFPILAYIGTYRVPKPDWADTIVATKRRSGEEELAKLVAWNKNYATVYEMACTYSTLGEAAMEHLEEMDVQFLLSKNTWEGIKKAKVVSFHSTLSMMWLTLSIT